MELTANKFLKYTPFFLWTEKAVKRKELTDIFKLRRGPRRMCAQNKLAFRGEKCCRVISGREFFITPIPEDFEKKYVSIYLLFHFACMALGFSKLQFLFVMFLISCNSFPIRQKLTVLINLPLLDIEPRSLTIRRKLLFSIGGVAGIRRK